MESESEEETDSEEVNHIFGMAIYSCSQNYVTYIHVHVIDTNMLSHAGAGITIGADGES